MKILKELMSGFDTTEYNVKNIRDCVNNEKVSIKGKIKIEEKSTKNGAPYFTLTISDSTGKITSAAWNNSQLFKFLTLDDSDSFVQIYGEVIIGKYTNMNVDNIIFIENDESETENSLDLSTLKTEFTKRINMISNEQLKKVVNYALKDFKNLENIPFTEKTAYNYKGGLMHQIIDSCDMVSSIVDCINCGFYKDSTLLNEDLLLAGAILGNLGKAITLEFKDNNIVKTFKGQLDEDSIYSREIATNAVNKVLKELKKENNTKYDDFEKLLIELLHMIASIKENTSWGTLTTPKSKHAMILAHINNLTYTKGLFENLEKSKFPGNDFVKPYENSRNYYVGNIIE